MSQVTRARLKLDIVRDSGIKLPEGALVLDLGCGSGSSVEAFRSLGYRAYGCDFRFKPGPHVGELEQEGTIRLISDGDYRLPFDDNSFDLVVSDQVLEHVRDYPGTLREIKRVMKPGAASLHLFPSRYKFVEPHVKIPLAGVFRSYGWLRLWTSLGIRSPNQQGLSADAAARRSADYLRENTNYLRKPQIRRLVGEQFRRVRFVEASFLKHRRPSGWLGRLIGLLPGLPALYSTLRGRVLIFDDIE